MHRGDTTIKNEMQKGLSMEFLKSVLGDELFEQFKTKVNAYNGDEANKDKLIKLANLASGEYVGKGKYDALLETISGKDTEIANAQALIEDLKKSSKGNEDIQTKLAKYEQDNIALHGQIAELKLKSAIKVALLSENVDDIDYITYKLEQKLKEDGKTLELDDDDNIKGWNDVMDGLKTQYPSHFLASTKIIKEQKLGKNDDDDNHKLTKADILKMPYAKRAELANNQPEVYEQIMHSNN